jgi:hypothetical protein
MKFLCILFGLVLSSLALADTVQQYDKLLVKTIVINTCTMAPGTSMTLDGRCAMTYTTSATAVGFASQSAVSGLVISEGQQLIWSIKNSSGTNFDITWPPGGSLKWRFGLTYNTVYANTTSVYTFMKLNGVVFIAAMDQMQ